MLSLSIYIISKCESFLGPKNKVIYGFFANVFVLFIPVRDKTKQHKKDQNITIETNR